MSKKDESILRMLDLIDLTRHGWRTTDNWDGDLAAVGIASVSDSARLVYVSTFEMPPGLFYYECECVHGTAPEDSETLETRDGATLDELLSALVRHLGLVKQVV